MKNHYSLLLWQGCFVVIRRTGADNAGGLSITTGADDEPP